MQTCDRYIAEFSAAEDAVGFQFLLPWLLFGDGPSMGGPTEAPPPQSFLGESGGSDDGESVGDASHHPFPRSVTERKPISTRRHGTMTGARARCYSGQCFVLTGCSGNVDRRDDTYERLFSPQRSCQPSAGAIVGGIAGSLVASLSQSSSLVVGNGGAQGVAAALAAAAAAAAAAGARNQTSSGQSQAKRADELLAAFESSLPVGLGDGGGGGSGIGGTAGLVSALESQLDQV